MSMSFEREERFIVVKRRHLSPEQETNLRRFMSHQRIQTVECVVVESDWPEYETVWGMIEQRVGADVGKSADPAAAAA
jgi:hypothetical protein